MSIKKEKNFSILRFIEWGVVVIVLVTVFSTLYLYLSPAQEQICLCRNIKIRPEIALKDSGLILYKSHDMICNDSVKTPLLNDEIENILLDDRLKKCRIAGGFDYIKNDSKDSVDKLIITKLKKPIKEQITIKVKNYKRFGKQNWAKIRINMSDGTEKRGWITRECIVPRKVKEIYDEFESKFGEISFMKDNAIFRISVMHYLYESSIDLAKVSSIDTSSNKAIIISREEMFEMIRHCPLYNDFNSPSFKYFICYSNRGDHKFNKDLAHLNCYSFYSVDIAWIIPYIVIILENGNKIYLKPPTLNEIKTCIDNNSPESYCCLFKPTTS